MIGLIGTKVGMTQVFDENGQLTPVSVIKVEPNIVVGARTPERDGYEAVIIGSIDMKKSRVTKPYAGQFAEGTAPKKFLHEIRGFGKDCSVGDSFGVELLEGIFYVDVVGVTKGKGFQGVMKRHGFGGGRSTHGSKFHRANGSTGQNTYPGKVMKGTKMAGRMGQDRQTVQNLKVVRLDAEKNVVLVKGAIPGAKEGMVIIQAATKMSN